MLNDYDQLGLDEFGQADFDSIKPQTPISRGQKIAAAALAFFGLFVMVAWAIQLNKSIRAPFVYQGSKQTTFNNQANQELILKNQDTDSDGLSDWDELNVYKTSPYLEDTDSDGIDDKTEIEAGTDPNCPSGRDCYSSGLANPAGSEETATSSEVFNLPEASSIGSGINNLGNQSANNLNQATSQSKSTQSSIDEKYLKIISGDIDPASLRQILLEHGMDKEMLDNISDEQLMQSFKQTWEEQMKQ